MLVAKGYAINPISFLEPTLNEESNGDSMGMYWDIMGRSAIVAQACSPKLFIIEYVHFKHYHLSWGYLG